MSINKSKIPIQNIFYMLCYAWDTLDYKDKISLGSDSYTSAENLFARIYIYGISDLIRRGVYKEYVSEDESLALIRGKLDFPKSIRQNTLSENKMICEYDELKTDNLFNQIVAMTLNKLRASKTVDNSLKEELSALSNYFTDVSAVRLSRSSFRKILYHRNNQHYRMILFLSELILLDLSLSETTTGEELDIYLAERQSQVFEKFVLNFYKANLPNSQFKTHAPIIEWKTLEEITASEVQLMPQMYTDIVIEDRSNKVQWIIDTKFYQTTLSSHYISNQSRARSSHLYQIFTYIMNSNFHGQIKGILLYPTIDEEINACFPIGKYGIDIRTVNLNTDWKNIECRLLEIVGLENNN